ncbi:hypothetical protein ACIA48_06540 [Mycobacterium sp. NPDC051804]|uniref:hypothetical protein n=1 Tax=Mycobacterium sp. NPDC051804 TaxID=3364295 RepID=UPI003797F8CE
MKRLAFGIAVVASASLVAAPPSTAQATVGTAVYVQIRQSFEQVDGDDQCVGTAALGPVRRGSSVVLSDGATAIDPPKVAVGQFFRSRLRDDICEALYITSAPVLPSFNVQFSGPAGELSPTFGPTSSEPVTYQPGIEQVVKVDIDVPPSP